MLEEFRQVTLGLELASAQLRGEKLTGPGVAARRKADADKPKTRASVVSDMEAAIAISYPLVEKSPAAHRLDRGPGARTPRSPSAGQWRGFTP